MVAGFCFLIGVLVSVYPWFFMLSGRGISRFFMLSPLRQLRAILKEGGLDSRLVLMSSYLVLAGLVGLVYPMSGSFPFKSPTK